MPHMIPNTFSIRVAIIYCTHDVIRARVRADGVLSGLQSRCRHWHISKGPLGYFCNVGRSLPPFHAVCPHSGGVTERPGATHWLALWRTPLPWRPRRIV